MKYFSNQWRHYLVVVEISNYKGILDQVDDDIIKRKCLRSISSQVITKNDKKFYDPVVKKLNEEGFIKLVQDFFYTLTDEGNSYLNGTETSEQNPTDRVGETSLPLGQLHHEFYTLIHNNRYSYHVISEIIKESELIQETLIKYSKLTMARRKKLEELLKTTSVEQIRKSIVNGQYSAPIKKIRSSYNDWEYDKRLMDRDFEKEFATELEPWDRTPFDISDFDNWD